MLSGSLKTDHSGSMSGAMHIPGGHNSTIPADCKSCKGTYMARDPVRSRLEGAEGQTRDDSTQSLIRQLSTVMWPLLQVLGLAAGERSHNIPHGFVRRELRGQGGKTGPYQAALRAAKRAAEAAPAGSDEVGTAALAKPMATQASAQPLQAAAPPTPKPIAVRHPGNPMRDMPSTWIQESLTVVPGWPPHRTDLQGCAQYVIFICCHRLVLFAGSVSSMTLKCGE